jgi:NTE family protein
MARKYKFGLTTSGGAARGMAHLGVVKALNEHGIYPDIISGSSAGAMVGAFLADGYGPDELLDIFIKKKIFEFVNLSLRKQGLLKATGMGKILESHLRTKTFEELEIPLYIAVSNLNTAKIEYLNSGSIVDAVLASSCIPVAFSPIKLNNSYYIDGGILDNLPFKPIKDQCNTLIAVNVNHAGPKDKIEGMRKILQRTMLLSIGRGLPELGKQCDLYIEPEGLAGYGLLEIGRGREMFEIGYLDAKEKLKDFRPTKERIWHRTLNKVKMMWDN